MTARDVLAAVVGGGPVPGRHLVVVAHPDDETISCGGLLQQLSSVTLVQLTSGANGDPAMTARRRAERTAALAALQVSPDVIDCGVSDRSAHLRLDVLLARVREAAARADVVWAHPYEGGHLDHDTAAWLVQPVAPSIRLEFASYHWDGTGSQFGRFWPHSNARESARVLRGDAWTRKAAALAAYESQAAILRKFREPEIERYRQAPVYDFSRPATPIASRWDVKRYAPTTAIWRQIVATAGRRAA